MIALCGFSWAGLVALTWKRRALRLAVIVATSLFALFFFLPGSATPDSNALRARFVERLKDYDGVRYIYGGENRRGVDCSGLVRAAMFRALLDRGLVSLDAGALRSAFTLWWRDTNAIQLGKGANGLTLPLGDGSPTHARRAECAPGRTRRQTSGSHVLAYLGETSIEADPDAAVSDSRSEAYHIADQEVCS